MITYSIPGNNNVSKDQFVNELASKFLEANTLDYSRESFSYGEGMWGIEIRINDNYIGSITGSNGVNSDSDDLWDDYYSVIDLAQYEVGKVGMIKDDCVYINEYSQLSVYRHTSEEGSESLHKMRYRYSTMLRFFDIDKNNKDYNKRFEIYRKDELFIKFPILNKLEGFNDEIICNLLYALFILNDIDKAMQAIRKDILRCYGPDYYDGLCNILDFDRENFHYITYTVGDKCTEYVYLENLQNK